MANYTVCDPDTLRMLCIDNEWFEEGSNRHYEKLFYANSHGCPIEEIATIIWLCSDDTVWCRRDILAKLHEARVYTGRGAKMGREGWYHG